MSPVDAAPAGSLQPGLLIDLTVPARARRLQLIRLAVDWAAGEAGLARVARENFVLAVDEACQNVIRHGYGGDCDAPIRIRVERSDDRISVQVMDTAAPVDPARIRSRPLDEPRPGGLGTRLMRDVLDEVVYDTAGPGWGNVLRLVKWLEGGSE